MVAHVFVLLVMLLRAAQGTAQWGISCWKMRRKVHRLKNGYVTLSCYFPNRRRDINNRESILLINSFWKKVPWQNSSSLKKKSAKQVILGVKYRLKLMKNFFPKMKGRPPDSRPARAQFSRLASCARGKMRLVNSRAREQFNIFFLVFTTTYFTIYRPCDYSLSGPPAKFSIKNKFSVELEREQSLKSSCPWFSHDRAIFASHFENYLCTP